DHRRMGHAFRCSQRLMAGTIERGRLPRVLVGVRHEAGIQLAAKLGFTSRTRVTSYFVDVF
ncbi:MAG: GNAT family N-acetyltransferase, partial [Planctomycetota bacterium]